MSETESDSELPIEMVSAVLRLLPLADPEFDRALEELCARHPERAAELRAAAREARFGPEVTSAGAASAPPRSPPLPDPLVGSRVGPFQVLQSLGAGGMGTVYLAEQREPVRRRVALKVIKLGMDTRAVLARFEAERQALAMMNHSNIAKVFEAGMTDDGKPYFAMEYVPGLPINRYCDEHTLTVEERLALFRQVCSGVQHAHSKGVIHRDLTPNNVLVSTQDGGATVKIIDFGLARATDHRLTERTLFTEHGVFAGTPEYMSPEQAGLDSLDIDMRSDVYTLGVLLYELLTGALPFEPRELRRAGYDGIRRIIREQSPPKPSTRVTTVGTATAASRRRTDATALLRRLRGDLDWVVMKCLEKDRTRRYESVGQLADDVQRHLDNEPVSARAPTLGYRLYKLARRYRAQLAAVAAVFVTLVAGLIGTTWFAFEAQAMETTAQARAREAIERKRDFELLSAVAELRQLRTRVTALAPAWPAQVPALRAWQAEAQALLGRRHEIEAAVRHLRADAVAAAPDAVERERRTHPRFAEWRQASLQLAVLERAQALRTGAQPLQLPPVTEVERALHAEQLNGLAFPLVAAEGQTRVYGQEARGLALARLAWEKASAEPAPVRANLADTLAWASFANGQDETALTASREALALADAATRPEYERLLAAVQKAVAAATGAAGERQIAALRARRDELAADLDAGAGGRVPVESQVLFDELQGLLAGMSALAEGEVVGVARDLTWAQRIDELTRRHPRARVSWEQARTAIARADGVSASTLYGSAALDLQPQTGLVPIGMNPQTRLWEFYHLRSAWDGVADPAGIAIPEFDDQGRLPVDEATGCILVLLPGGSFAMGAQSYAADAPNYDRDAGRDERVRTVTLAPFFLGRHEVTQAQWRRLTGTQPSGFRPGYQVGDHVVTWANPVEKIDWDTCMQTAARFGLTLPTEAQWEYGCRAGTSTPYVCAFADLVRFANVADQSLQRKGTPGFQPEAWDDGYYAHAPVGTFAANAFGLYDVHGNVAEWTADGAGLAAVEPRAGDGGRGDPRDVRLRIARGGSIAERALAARSAAAHPCEPEKRSVELGLRLARPLQR